MVERLEVWRPVAGWKNYEVSNFGRVRSIRTTWRLGRVLKPVRLNGGYMKVTLCAEYPVRKDLLIHRLVAVAFHGEPTEERPHVNHKDLDKSNNKASNLEWVSRSENDQHAARRGKKFIPALHAPESLCRGERWHKAHDGQHVPNRNVVNGRFVSGQTL